MDIRASGPPRAGQRGQKLRARELYQDNSQRSYSDLLISPGWGALTSPVATRRGRGKLRLRSSRAAGCGPYATAAQGYLPSFIHTSSKSSAALANVHMFASRSALPVSTVIARSIGPVTAIQAWPAASP
jgi:hypothetical protein